MVISYDGDVTLAISYNDDGKTWQWQSMVD
jgi:hypothetical protein